VAADGVSECKEQGERYLLKVTVLICVMFWHILHCLEKVCGWRGNADVSWFAAVKASCDSMLNWIH
jgi:hypothetical protein